jgi:hypothetical protein
MTDIFAHSVSRFIQTEREKTPVILDKAHAHGKILEKLDRFNRADGDILSALVELAGIAQIIAEKLGLVEETNTTEIQAIRQSVDNIAETSRQVIDLIASNLKSLPPLQKNGPRQIHIELTNNELKQLLECLKELGDIVKS